MIFKCFWNELSKVVFTRKASLVNILCSRTGEYNVFHTITWSFIPSSLKPLMHIHLYISLLVVKLMSNCIHNSRSESKRTCSTTTAPAVQSPAGSYLRWGVFVLDIVIGYLRCRQLEVLAVMWHVRAQAAVEACVESACGEWKWRKTCQCRSTPYAARVQWS